MGEKNYPEVAVLLATYNGDRYVAAQIRSYALNRGRFQLHWLDDHSSDNTRVTVRSIAHQAGIDLQEWHQPEHLGVPAAFLKLLECVEADIYLFSDQDDIWQTGKIDVTVESLLQDFDSSALCYSDPLIFRDSEPDRFYSYFDVVGARVDAAIQESRLFMGLALGHTQGFTRPVRDLFLTHKETAYTYAFMHDLWIYDLAMAAGTVRLLREVPTTLYRFHDRSITSTLDTWKGTGLGHMRVGWQQHQKYRRSLARHARGFILAAPTLPQGPRLERLLSVAHIVASLDHRQPLATMIDVLRRGVLWPSRRMAMGLATNCLWMDAGQRE